MSRRLHSAEVMGFVDWQPLLLSNLLANVPAVMLLPPHLGADARSAGLLLAIVSTLAGNLLLVASIANPIVVDLAERQGIAIGGRAHLRLAAPVALAMLALSSAWLPFARGS